MAYTVSSTPSASAQTLNNAFQGMMEMPENLREIEKEEYLRKLEEQKQARAERYADAQLRLMDSAYQDRMQNRQAKADLINAFNTNQGSSPDVLAKNIAPFLAKTGDYGTALQLHNNAHAYSQQQARIADQQAADKATSSWFGSMAGKGTGNTDNAFGRFANSFMSGEWMGQGSRASQPTAQDVGSFIYGSGNASMSPQAKQLAAKQILAYLPNGKTQQPVKFGTHDGQPYAINANGTVNWGSRQPTSTQPKTDEFPKFIKDENGNIYSRELPQTEVWDKEKGRNEIIKGGLNPAYINAWKRKHGYPVVDTPTRRLPKDAASQNKLADSWGF